MYTFQVLEVAFVSAGALLFGPRDDPSKAVAPRRLLPSLLLGILRKLTGMGGAEERLLQPLGRSCLAVAGNMYFEVYRVIYPCDVLHDMNMKHTF